jgi:hypothetical protein
MPWPVVSVAGTVGFCVGIALAVAGGKTIASQLYGITPQDPRVFAMVIVTMLMTGLTAAYPRPFAADKSV